MLLDRRIVAVTPAGRKRYMELLVPQILAYRPIVDSYQIWVNTANSEDIAYFLQLEADYPDFIVLRRLPKECQPGGPSIHRFFPACTDPDTVYVRFDDDIVYLDTLDAFKAFVTYRIEHPEHFIVFANILNNAVITHFHQTEGRLTLPKQVQNDCLCPNGWEDPLIAEAIHRQVLSRSTLESFHFPPRVIETPYRISINCISWLGSRFQEFGGNVDEDEEPWLAALAPAERKETTCVYGDYACVHFAFWTQRRHLDNTTILSEYASKLSLPSPLTPPKPAPFRIYTFSPTRDTRAAAPGSIVAHIWNTPFHSSP